METHEAVNAWILRRLREAGLFRGKTLGVAVHPGPSGDTGTVGKTLEAMDRTLPAAKAELPTADGGHREAQTAKREGTPTCGSACSSMSAASIWLS